MAISKSDLASAYRWARIINQVESISPFEWGKITGLRPSVYIAQRVPSIPRHLAGVLICHLLQPEELESLQTRREGAYDVYRAFKNSVYASHRQAAPELFKEYCQGAWRLDGIIPNGKAPLP